MRNKATEYPHPVLTKYDKDFIDSNFSIKLVPKDSPYRQTETDILFEIKCDLDCKGIVKLLESGKAKIILSAQCSRTSFRKVYDLKLTETTPILIPKKNVVKELELQAMIIATGACNDYKLSEFNSNYFGDKIFSLRHGDIIACEPGITIEFSSVLEKKVYGVVKFQRNNRIKEIEVSYESDYIMISLPDKEYISYFELKENKGVERFLQNAFILPAITEAISKLRYEQKIAKLQSEYNLGTIGNDSEEYEGTIWAKSIVEALKKVEIYDLSECSESDFELANKLLGNVVSDSFNNLKSMRLLDNLNEEGGLL